MNHGRTHFLIFFSLRSFLRLTSYRAPSSELRWRLTIFHCRLALRSEKLETEVKHWAAESRLWYSILNKFSFYVNSSKCYMYYYFFIIIFPGFVIRWKWRDRSIPRVPVVRLTDAVWPLGKFLSAAALGDKYRWFHAVLPLVNYTCGLYLFSDRSYKFLSPKSNRAARRSVIPRGTANVYRVFVTLYACFRV